MKIDYIDGVDMNAECFAMDFDAVGYEPIEVQSDADENMAEMFGF